jgi:hypothetical protein
MSAIEPKIALNLSVAEVQYVLNALCTRPINEALSLVQRIEQEANFQIEAAKKAAAQSHGNNGA